LHTGQRQPIDARRDMAANRVRPRRLRWWGDARDVRLRGWPKM